MRISSFKVFSLLITLIGEATGIDCENLLNILRILISCILKLEALISRALFHRHFTGTLLKCQQLEVSIKFISLLFSYLVVKMNSTLRRASAIENCNENESDAILLFKPAVLRNKNYQE